MSKTPNTECKTAASISDRKLEANRQNAHLSTGPTTDEGKAISARNNFRHGFTGAFCLLPEENLEEFHQLCRDLAEEHQPATVTESLLVNDMARHYWLYQRALRLQEECFADNLTNAAVEHRLNLFLRYATTHERAFRRSLSDLLKLRKDRLHLQRGFESQARERAAESRREAQEQRKVEAAERLESLRNDPAQFIEEMFRQDDPEDQVAISYEPRQKRGGKNAA